MAAYMQKLYCVTARCNMSPTYEVARSGTDRFGLYCTPHAKARVKQLNDTKESR